MKTVDRYIGQHVVGATLTVLLVLLAIFSFFAFIDELEDIGRGTYTLATAAWVVTLSLPGLIYELFPIAALIGSLLGLGALTERNEVAVIRCAGVSKLRIIWSVMQAGLVFVLLAIIVGEVVFPFAEREARALRSNAIEDRVAAFTGDGFWARDGNSFVNIRTVRARGDFGDVNIFEFDDELELRQLTHADTAKYDDGRWTLTGVGQTRFIDGMPQVTRRKQATWSSRLDPGLINMAALKPETLSFVELARYVDFARRNGQNAQRWEFALWTKLAYPLATAVMVYLAIPLVLSGARHVAISRRILVGAVIGLGFHVVNQASGHLGVVAGLPAIASALAPTALLFVLGTLLIARVR